MTNDKLHVSAASYMGQKCINEWMKTYSTDTLVVTNSSGFNSNQQTAFCGRIDWLSMVLRLRQHNIGYTADGFYRSDDPTNSVKALTEGG